MPQQSPCPPPPNLLILKLPSLPFPECPLYARPRDGDVNERCNSCPQVETRQVIWKAESTWRSGHLLWSELPPFKGFWTQASWFQRQKAPPPPFLLSLRCSPLSPWTLFPRLRRSPLPAILGRPGALPCPGSPAWSLFGLFPDAECGGGGWLGTAGSQQLRPLRPRAKGSQNLVERC